MNISQHNRSSWNDAAKNGNPWSIPVSAGEIMRARQGDWKIILTPNKPVPAEWFGDIRGKAILCLASGGGQQAPILAAAGAQVTSFDNSDEQLALDRLVANRDGLDLRTLRGDMANLSVYADAQFDLIFHPVANLFVPDINPVWRECARVLKSGGRLLSGFMNPAFYLFDHDGAEKTGRLEVKYRLPFSSLTSLDAVERQKLIEKNLPLEFGHSLDDQIGGQIKAGFVISGLYEDDWSDDATLLNRFGPMYIATLARKLPLG